MSFVQEFKDFAMKGSVVDMAVGLIIGGAFGKIITSLVEDLLMPPIGVAMGGVNFTSLKYPLQEAVTDATGKVVTEAVSLNYGNFVQTTLDFIIVALCIFMVIKMMNSWKKAEEEAPEEPSEDVVLLREIRDSLKK